MGLTQFEVAKQLRQGFYGQEVQQVQKDLDDIKIWIKYTEDERSSIGSLKNMDILSPDQIEIPLDEISTFTLNKKNKQIKHINGVLTTVIEAAPANRKDSVLDVLKMLEETFLIPLQKKFPTVTYTFGGQFEDHARIS